MQFLFLCLFVCGIVAVDQFTKYLTVMNLRPMNADLSQLAVLKEAYPITDAQIAELPQKAGGIPGVFHFSHYLNDGAAWSMMEGMRWLFVALFVVLTGFVLWEYFKKPLPFKKTERWLIAAIYGGGLGNMIDRVRMGYVVDMIKTDFIDFPVFNVADIFISCGCILLIVHLIFFNKAFWKDGKNDSLG